MNFVPGRKEEKNINWAPTMSQAFSWLFSQPCEMDILSPLKDMEKYTQGLGWRDKQNLFYIYIYMYIYVYIYVYTHTHTHTHTHWNFIQS